MKRYRFERDAEQDRELDEAGQSREARGRRVSPGKVPRSMQLGEDAHLDVAVGARGKGLYVSPVSPGKRAPSARVGSPAPEAVSLQHRRALAPGVDERKELEIAARGLTDSGGPLPYIEELQRAFGRHDLKDVRAATGDEAGRANERMSSVAYAMGDTVVFRDSSPDLFTVAHEVAHVIQQRAGSVPTGTIGQSGDRHEAHADAVAERVVRGQSAEDLLDQVAPAAGRDTVPAAPASVQRFDDEDYQGLSTNHAILQALLDGDEEDALTLMRRVVGASEANLVLNSCQALATSCLDDSEIAEAAAILVLRGGSLHRAMYWMYDEGTDWISVVNVISCATAVQRAELVSNGWRDWFVDDVVDNEQMSELVDLLGMDLATKLDWMSEEGTDWNAVRSKIVAAPAEERAVLVTVGWRDWFIEDVVDGEGMSDLVDLLGMDLETKLDWLFAEKAADWIILVKIDAATPEEKATLVTDGWRDWFVEKLADESMPGLVDLLPLRLSEKLDWMWRSGAYAWSAVKSKIEAAPPDQRLALVTDEWRDWFADDVVDNDEMSELVDLIGMDLVAKLDWLRAEGSDYEAMIGKISQAPEAERVALYDSDLRAFFVKHCDDEEMAVTVILLGGTLIQQLSWMAAEGSRGDLVLDRVNAAPAADRPALYDDGAVLEMIREFIPIDRVPIIEAAGGTPAQQMDLFGDDTLIRLLTWATPSADWVDAIIAVRSDAVDLLEVAKGDPAGWAPFIQPKLWDLLEDHEETLYPEDRVAVFWAAYGSGSTFTADQILHFFKLVFGREITPAGEDFSVSTGLLSRTRFSVVAPTSATAQALMDCVKPGGGGPTGIGRAEVKTGTIAFCTHRNKEELGITGWTTLSSEELDTSSYWRGYVIIRAVGPNPASLGVQPGALDTNLIGTASDGTPEAAGGGGAGLNYFQNHVRHEIGHAVGAESIGSMSQSGNDFAEEYGGWEVSSESEFLGAMWSGQGEPATGWPSLTIGAASVTVTDDDVRDWCVGVISSGREPANAIGSIPGTFAQKKSALAGSIWSGENLVAYLSSIPTRAVAEVPGTAFEFPGFAPGSSVQIFSTRWGNRFVKYSLEAYNALTVVSWYSRSSPKETFAEIYTARYGGGAMPVATSGGDPDAFFTELEAQRDPMFGEPPPREPHLDGR